MPEFKIDWLRFTWQEGFGPGPSYFPFWIAVILGFSSLVTLVTTVLRPGEGETFVSVRSFGRVLAVLVPSFVYAMLIGGVSVGPVTVPGIGIYVSSAIFICFFMLAIGRQGVLKSILVSIGVPLMLFFMFEKWFLVPLPKGPLETWLGYSSARAVTDAARRICRIRATDGVGTTLPAVWHLDAARPAAAIVTAVQRGRSDGNCTGRR